MSTELLAERARPRRTLRAKVGWDRGTAKYAKYANEGEATAKDAKYAEEETGATGVFKLR